MAELTFIVFDSVALDSEPAFLNEDGLESSGSESSSPSVRKSKKDILQCSGIYQDRIISKIS